MCLLLCLFLLAKPSAGTRTVSKSHGDAALQKDHNLRLASKHTADSLQLRVKSLVEENLFDKHFVGLALHLRNHSPYKLARPMFYQRCGYQEDGTHLKKYHEHHNVRPRFEEVFLFHNKEKEVKVDTDRAKVVVHSVKDLVSASARLTQGCQALLTLDVFGPQQGSHMLDLKLGGNSSLTFAVVVVSLCALFLLGFLLLAYRVKARGRKRKFQKDYLQDGEGDETIKINTDSKALSDQGENSDEEILHMSSINNKNNGRPRAVSFSDRVS